MVPSTLFARTTPRQSREQNGLPGTWQGVQTSWSQDASLQPLRRDRGVRGTTQGRTNTGPQGAPGSGDVTATET